MPSVFPAFIRHLALGIFLLGLVRPLAAVEKQFVVSGAAISFQDVSADVAIIYQSMRLNRARNEWNVEVILTNRSARVINGPVLLSIEGFTGTTGVRVPDGTDSGGLPFFDLSGNIGLTNLAPGRTSTPRTLALGVGSGGPQITAKVFGEGVELQPPVALTRALDQIGHPLEQVRVEETGPLGVKTYFTETSSGNISLGQAKGIHRWKFSAPGFLPAYREMNFTSSDVVLLANPRLLARDTNNYSLTPAGGGRIRRSEIEINYAPGTFSEDANGILTSFSGQTLPALLPAGWSPLQGFSIETTQPQLKAAEVRITPWGLVNAGDTGILARWDDTTFAWVAASGALSMTGNIFVASFSQPGAYVLVAADGGSGGPARPMENQALTRGLLVFTNFGNLRASGKVTPAVRRANRVADLVTATAEVVISNATENLPSGLPLRCEIQETYEMRDGTKRTLPRYETFITAFQKPGEGDPKKLGANFPLQPILLFGAEELAQATIQVDVLTPTPFAGAIFDSAGGHIADSNIEVSVGSGVLTNRLAAQLRFLDPTNFSGIKPANFVIVRAFELNVGGLAGGQRLLAGFQNLPANQNFVLAQVINQSGYYGFEPVERLSTDSGGALRRVDGSAGSGLRGLSQSGQYVLVQVTADQGLIAGTARDANGNLLARAPVQIANQPWLTFSRGDGTFYLSAGSGPVPLLLTDLRTGNSRYDTVVITNTQFPTVVSLGTTLVGPRVIAITPADQSTAVPLVSSVSLTFTKPLNLGSVTSNSFRLVNPSNELVPLTVTFNLRGNVVTLLPINPLSPRTLFQVVVGTNLTDLSGLPLEGPTTFEFTTVNDLLNRNAGAQLVSYEPSNGVIRVQGSQGIADPGRPVILVNDTSGRTSTVLSQPDGSFGGGIDADSDDVIYAVFVNENGTRNQIPVSRQVYRDGSVGLFGSGGVIEAQGETGPIQLMIEAGTIPGKAIFKIEPVALSNIMTEVNGVLPDSGGSTGKILGGFRFSAKGNYTKMVDVSFPVDVASLGLPAEVDPTNATFGLVAKRIVDGETVYELIDRMQYEDGKLVTHSPPFFGLLGPYEDILTMPLLMAIGSSMTVHGSVKAGEIQSLDPNGEPIIKGGTAKPLPGALVSAYTGTGTRVLGRLRGGTVFATASGTDAAFTLMVNVTIGAVSFRATHPAFPTQAPTRAVPALTGQDRLSIGNILYPFSLVFGLPTSPEPDKNPPNISFSSAPDEPAPGSSATVRVVALDDTRRPVLSVRVLQVTSLAPGTNLTVSQITLLNTTNETFGDFGTRAFYSVSAPIPALVVLEASSHDTRGNSRTSLYAVRFGGVAGGSDTNLPPADPRDKTGPRVVSSSPTATGSLSPGDPIILNFSEPIDRKVLSNAVLFTLSPGSKPPTLELSPDQLTLSVVYYDLQEDTDYTLTLPASIRDLNGNLFDQNPLVSGNDGYSLAFHTRPVPKVELPGIKYGGGAVVYGNYGYVLERDKASGAGLKIFDLSDPLAPVKVGERLFGGGFPRDLLLIPNFVYKRWSYLPPVTNTLLVVVGGEFGAGKSQYLKVLELSDPVHPRQIVGTILTSADNAGVTRAQWSAPVLSYLEVGEIEVINLLNLQTLILSDFIPSGGIDPNDPNGPADEFQARNMESQLWPRYGSPGLDANYDGDFVDPGDVLPQPAREPFGPQGKFYSLTLPDTSQFINDFAMENRGTFIGVALEGGYLLATNGLPDTNQPVASCYRTLLNGQTLEREPASVTITNGRARRVKSLFRYPLVANGQSTTVDLMLVGVRMNAGFENGQTNRIQVLDVTDPTGPRLLSEIPIPCVDSISSILIREDGVVMVGSSSDIFLLDPTRITERVGANGIHPSLIGVLRNIGEAGRTFGSSSAGFNLAASGYKTGTEVVNKSFMTPPHIEIISFTNNPFLATDLLTNSEIFVSTLIGQRHPAPFLYPSIYRTQTGIVESTLVPPNAATHYYALVHLPGGAGEKVELALESLNAANHPLRPKGFLFPPVHALSLDALGYMDQYPRADDAPVRTSTAWRLSTNKLSALYNVYLSRPIALVGEEMSVADLTAVTNVLDRDVLWSGRFLRVTLDPSMRVKQMLSNYVSQVDRNEKALIPGTEEVAESLPGEYLQGPNPGPVTGGVALQGALNAVAAHSGEMMIDTVDIHLPGRRLPIEFKRNYSGQGLYEGPFGRGWDFNFNQRVVELHPRVVPPGLKMVQVNRGTFDQSDVGASKDLIFYTGGGKSIVYKYAGTNAPPEIAGDPLVRFLDWTNHVSSYYLPPPGAFTPFFKFKDGNYARLEVDGKQYWYNPDGKLSKIYDRFDSNALEMVYNRRGELIQILDELGRALDLGYWRLQSDTERRQGVDEITADRFVAGHVAKLLDYSKRDVRFYYTTNGVLDRREGVKVETGVPGSFLGRQITRYHYSSGATPSKSGKSIIGITASDSSTSPIISATKIGDKGRDSVSKVRIGSKETEINLSHDNTAASMTNGNATATIVSPDSTETKYNFDPLGRPMQTTLSASNAAPEKTVTEYWTNGLVKAITLPEGNRVEYYYDTNNPSLRSRGNLVRTVRKPGPRGGNVLEGTAHFDNWYNLPEGRSTDFNGNATTHTLSGDHRWVASVEKGGETETFFVNSDGLVETHQSIDQIVRTWRYNANGFIERETVGSQEWIYTYRAIAMATSDQAVRGIATEVTDPNGVVTQYLHDERNQLIKETRAGMVRTYVYDEGGHMVENSATVESSRVKKETIIYNQYGFIVSNIVQQLEVDGGKQDLVTIYEPDDHSRVKSVTLPNGARHFMTYDHAGRLIKHDLPGAFTETYRYDKNGNLGARIIGARTTGYRYDGHDRLIAVTNANGLVSGMSLDGNGNVLGTASIDANGDMLAYTTNQVDALNRYRVVGRLRDSGMVTSHYDYDTAHRAVSVTDALGAVATTYMDESGRQMRSEAPHRTMLFEYDGNGNVTSRTSLENGESYREQFEYNARNQLITRTNNAGGTSRIEVELDGRAVKMTDREGNSSTNGYTLAGEVSAAADANNVITKFEFAPMRQMTKQSDPAGHDYRFVYDNASRLRQIFLPNNEVTAYNNYNDLLQSELISMPRGVTMNLTYSLDGQITNRLIRGLGPDRNEGFIYDGLHRPVVIELPNVSMAFRYDLFGFIKQTDVTLRFLTNTPATPSLTYSMLQTADDGGFRQTLSYPDASVTVTNRRDQVGRLVGLDVGPGETVMDSATYAAASLIGESVMGTNQVILENSYDAVQQLTARRYRRGSDGRVLVDLRYAYDKTGMQRIRQAVHGGGRADIYSYDPGYRLVRGDLGARLQLGAADNLRMVTGFTSPVGAGTWVPGKFARTATYSGTDVLVSNLVVNPDAVDVPPQASGMSQADEFLFAGNVDGFVRGRDVLGNATRVKLAVRIPGSASPVLVGATLDYDVMGQLVRIARDDGVVILNEYDAGGLRVRRNVTGSPSLCVPSDRAYLYDGNRLIEERDLTTGAVVARYYYGDTGDELIAGDFRFGGSTQLRRHYFLTDRLSSVVGITDGTGQVLERMSYDLWGQPRIEKADNLAPRLARVLVETNTLAIIFSEPVMPGLTGGNSTSVVTTARSLASLFLIGGGQPGGQIFFEENRPGARFGSAFRFVPSGTLSGTIQLKVVGGAVVDSWGNTNAEETVSINSAGGSYIGAAEGSTEPEVSARSEATAQFLFHGQVFDYETGLVYCRARYYDPYSGTFLQRDPAGMGDSVNQYAAFANNPVNMRDPTGHAIEAAKWGHYLQDIGSQASLKKDGLFAYLEGQLISSVGSVLTLGEGLAEGLEKLDSKAQGTFGLLERMKGAELVISEGQKAASAFGTLMAVGQGVASKVQGFRESMANKKAARENARGFLAHKGLAEFEIDGFINGMEAYKKKNKVKSIEVSIRDFGEKAAPRRANAEAGLPGKGATITAKSNAGAKVVDLITSDNNMIMRGKTFNSDTDLLHVKIDGRSATRGEVDQLSRMINREQSKAHQAMGLPGHPNVSIQHGAHVHAPELFGQPFAGHIIDREFLETKARHPGDGFSIRLEADGTVLGHQTSRASIQRSVNEAVLKLSPGDSHIWQTFRESVSPLDAILFIEDLHAR